MSSLLGLDLTKNISYFTVPAAYALAFGPLIYAVVNAGSLYDPANPRELKDRVSGTQTLSTTTKQRILRAKSASDNGFETLGFYAAAVVAANVAGVETGLLNRLSLGYVASRAFYLFVYIYLQGRFPALAQLRSLAWQSGTITTLVLWFAAGKRAMAA